MPSLVIVSVKLLLTKDGSEAVQQATAARPGKNRTEDREDRKGTPLSESAFVSFVIFCESIVASDTGTGNYFTAIVGVGSPVQVNRY
jgi:hypothetical protein